MEQLHQERGTAGRVGRRLQHDRVAAHQRRHHLPAGDGHREVPRRDQPGHADRLADAHGPLVGELGRHRVTEEPPPLPRHEERDVDALLDVATSLRQDLAHLARHEARKALLVLGKQCPEAIQDLPALGSRGGAPRGIGHLRRARSPQPRPAQLTPGSADHARAGRRDPATRRSRRSRGLPLARR